jgi:hypothetical protein
MDNDANNFTSTCQIRGNGTGAEFGYNGTGNNFSTGFTAGSAGRSQLRTSVLSNGLVIWDVAGNVDDWTSTQVPIYGSIFSKSGYYTSSSISVSSFSDAFLPFTYVQTSRELNQSTGAGYYIGRATPTHYAWFGRGGGKASGALSGVFNLQSWYTVPSWESTVGFRCVFVP